MGLFSWLFKKNKKEESALQPQTLENPLEIEFNVLKENETIDESKLVLIKDERLIERITSVAPTLLQLVQTSKLVNETKELSLAPVYRAVIPKGAKLVSSKLLEGAKRGAYIDKNNNLGQANLVELNTPNLEKATSNQVVSSVFSVASLIVGQYYMTKINNKLDEIADNVGKIYSFLNNEYLSKITSTIKQIREIAEYQISTLENKESCLEEKQKLNVLKGQTTQLLDQANLSINELMQQKITGFREYVAKTNEIESWRKYQIVLTEVLYQICSLNFVFGFGKESKEKVFSTLNQCNLTSQKISQMLIEYHKTQQEELKISLDKQTISNGKIAEFFARVVGKDKWKERQIPQEVAEVIIEQMKPFESPKIDQDLKYEQDVTLISKQGEIYYLPAEN